jgi:integrase
MHKMDTEDWKEATRHQRYSQLRRFLRWLWEYHHAPKLDGVVRRVPKPRPRNVTVRRDELETVMEKAKPSLRLWLLLCSDLGLRSGTANKISGTHYDAEKKELRFCTKGGSKQTLPVTEEIAQIIAPLDHHTDKPYVWQLRQQDRKRGPESKTYAASGLRRELKAIGESINANRFIPHDLRRTSAVAVYEETGDLRAVQQFLGHINLETTLQYLDHDSVKVSRSVLERIKRPAWRKERTA